MTENHRVESLRKMKCKARSHVIAPIPTVIQVTILLAGCLVIYLAVPVSPVQAQSQNTVELSGSAFKNVTALAEMPANQMGKVMNIMSASLGVNCQFYHEAFDFAKEHVAYKDVGRKMIEMTLAQLPQLA